MKLLNLLKLDSGRHNHTLESNNCCFERPTQQLFEPKKEPKAKNTRPAVIETSDTDTDSDDSANDDP